MEAHLKTPDAKSEKLEEFLWKY
jgi:hypothetical protein